MVKQTTRVMTRVDLQHRVVHLQLRTVILVSIVAILWVNRVDCFQLHVATTKTRTIASSIRHSTAPLKLAATKIKSYSYGDWNLTYRYKASQQAAATSSSKPTNTNGVSLSQQQQEPSSSSSESIVIFIHPVGIGMNSWFWERVMNEWTDDSSYTLMAPDLIGCGMSNGGDAWDPSQKALSFPLGWVQGIEPLLPIMSSEQQRNPTVTVVVQGGLAPVGVLLAARNPNVIQNLILCSPPTYQDMITPVPEVELQRNLYFLLENTWISNSAFRLLESDWAVRFFSNLFLFDTKSQPACDDDWMDRIRSTASPALRIPVAIFNAGFCNHRSWEEELVTLSQRTLILSGAKDQRSRQDYVTAMKHCVWNQWPTTGCNVLPWEDPVQVCRAIQDFIGKPK